MSSKLAKKLGREERYPNGWSYSAWSLKKKCAFAYYCVRVLGIKDTSSSPALENGIKQHAIAEGYLKGTVTSLPPKFDPFKKHYAQLKKMRPVVEKFWGVSRDWEPMNYGSWVVMKMDAALEPSKKNDYDLWIQDLKTGKEYMDSHEKQSDLYVAIGSALFPKFRSATTEFWYIDQGYPTALEYTKKRVLALRKFWSAEGDKTLKPQKDWLPSPSMYNCQYCHLSKLKGGPCKDYYKGS